MMFVKIWKFGLIALLLCGFAATSGTARAQQRPASLNVNFAVVNYQRIFRDAAATRSIGPQIAKLKKHFESQFKDVQKKLQAAEQDLQTQRTILSPEAYAEKQKAFKNQVNSVQRDVQTVQQLVARAEGDAYKSVRQAFHLITQELAKERSFELIFPRSGLIHADARYDISDEVLKRLNKRLPSVTIKLPAVSRREPATSSSKKK